MRVNSTTCSYLSLLDRHADTNWQTEEYDFDDLVSDEDEDDQDDDQDDQDESEDDFMG